MGGFNFGSDARTNRAWPGTVSCLVIASVASTSFASPGPHSVARIWNEQLLSAIRRDLARPTVHARNLFHVSMAMWDGWAAYDAQADTFLIREHATAADIQAAREETISYAAYRVMRARFATSPEPRPPC